MSVRRVMIPGLPGGEVLNKTATDIFDSEFGEDLDAVMSDMTETMYANSGVGLAGPQIGINRRIIVIDTGHVGEHTEDSPYGGGYAASSLKMVNPVIMEASEETSEVEEGCLSLPTLTVKVSRPDTVVVRYKTPLGESVEETFTGFVATIVQHEIDHLNGITLLKYASSLKRSVFKRKVAKANRRLKEMLRNAS